MNTDNNLSDLIEQEWDAIVVGTGAGGATLGHALAKAGKKVLFCERGHALSLESSALRGNYAEHFFAKPSVAQSQHSAILARAGRFYDEIEDHSHARTLKYIPLIGAGAGGSSALYGMAMERFSPSDFQPRSNYPDAGESTLPEFWPISYEELVPYYQMAEELFRVHGTVDSLRTDAAQLQYLPASTLHAVNQELYDFFKDKNLHPYKLPLACDQVDGCEGCQGFLCKKTVKMTAEKYVCNPRSANTAHACWTSVRCCGWSIPAIG